MAGGLRPISNTRAVWLGALGGVLIVGGIAIIPLLICIWVWEHHMFIMGVSSPLGSFVILSIPLVPVLAGVLVLFKALRNKAD